MKKFLVFLLIAIIFCSVIEEKEELLKGLPEPTQETITRVKAMMLKIFEQYWLDMAYKTCKRTFAQQYSYLCDEVAEEYKNIHK